MKKLRLISLASAIVSVCLLPVGSIAASAEAYSVSASGPWLFGQSNRLISSVATYAGSGDFGAENGAPLAASFRSPESAALQPDGTLLVSDAKNQLIRKVTASEVSTYAGIDLVLDDAGLPQGSWIDGSSEQAMFSHPQGLAVAADGSVYVADTGNHAIRRIDASGQVSTVAGTGVLGLRDGAGGEAQFNAPSDVAVAADGTVYVADTLNHAIRKIAVDGTVSTLNAPSDRIVELIPGLVEPGGDYADGKLSEAKFNEPSGLALDDKGNLFVSDTGNQCIRYIDFAAGTVATVAGDPTLAYSPDSLYKDGDYADGSAREARFNYPKGVALAPDGGLLIADSLNHVIRLWKDGRVTTVAGVPGTKGQRNAIERDATLQMPYDVAVDKRGHLFVADAYNNKIREIVPFHYPDGMTDRGIKVFYNNGQIQFDALPEYRNERAMVPVRVVAEALHYKVDFSADGGKQTIQLSKDKDVIVMKEGAEELSVFRDGSAEDTALKIDAAPYVKSDRTYVPVRFFAEIFGLDVQWEPAAHVVILRDRP